MELRLNCFNELNAQEIMEINGGSGWAVLGVLAGTFGVVAGVGVAAIGVATLNPVAVAGGVCAIGSGGTFIKNATTW